MRSASSGSSSPRLAVVLASVLAALGLLGVALAHILAGSHPPVVAPTPAPLAPLARHVLLVVLDGLRHDYAADPAMAPGFARRMREDAHADVWAGRVTMTSSAVLSLGTGQRGTFANIVLNLNAARARHDDLLARLRASGLRAALAGDEVWAQTFGDFDAQVVDERGLSLKTDDSPAILAAAERLARTEPRPALLVAHFVAPDHMAHAYRADSATYREHLRALDASLEALYARLPSDWTVVALSDHAALANGQHGTDAPEMRLTPLVAFGPGVRAGAASRPLEQVDVAPTLATLLGVPVPVHGRGTPATDLLDLSPAGAASVACADAARALRLAAAEGAAALDASTRAAQVTCASTTASPDERRAAGEAIARAWDGYLDRSAERAGVRAVGATIAIVVALALFVAWRLSRARTSTARSPTIAAVAVAGLASAAAALTLLVDHTRPPLNDARAIAVALAGLPLYAAVVRPAGAARRFGRRPLFALAVMPTVLAWAFPTNARTYSFVVAAAGAVVWLLAPHAEAHATSWPWKGRRVLGARALVASALALAGLAVFAFGPEDDPVRDLAARPDALLVLGLALVAVWLVALAPARDGARARDVVIAVGAAIAGPLARRVVPAPIGLAALVVLPACAIVLARRGRATLAAGLAFGAYGLLSRDVEVLGVAAAALLAEAVGSSAGRGAPDGEDVAARPIAPFTLASLLAVGFALSFLARVAVQRGLTFTTMDWGVGAFGSPEPSQLRVGLALGAKYVLPGVLVGWLLARRLPERLARALALGACLLGVGRFASMALVFFASDQAAYWTAQLAFSDLLPSLLATFAAALSAAATRGASARRARPAGARAAEREELSIAA